MANAEFQKKEFVILKKILTLLVIGVFLICIRSAGAASESVLPPIEEGGTQLSTLGKVLVSQFRLDGNTVFSDEELAPLLAPYLNREITAEEMHELKNDVTRFYIANGYVNSGAIIPDQQVKDGVILMRIVEGTLGRTEITGNTWLRTGYIDKRLKLAVGKKKEPLNINVLQEHLKLLKQDSHIENINASLNPGLEPGDASLNVEIEEARPYHITFRFNNHNSPSIGPYRGEVEIRHDNLSGWGDSLSAEYALTEGLDDYSFRYSVPVTRWDTTLTLSFDRAEAVVVSEPFDKLDIRSDTKTYAAAIRHPFYKTLSKEFAMGFKFEKRESETSLLDSRFSFPGSGSHREKGETEFTVSRFSQEWVNRGAAKVLAAYSSFNLGNVKEGDLDGGFFTWLGQFQWLQRIKPLNSQILFSANLQLSADSLVSAEKFSIGGASTVRGYRENLMTTDNGLTSSLEWRVPVAQLRIPGLGKKQNDGMLEICPFFDLGKGWNKELEDPDPDMIYSAGIGMRWLVSKRIHAEFYWGKYLRDIPDPGEYDIQDDGIYFQIVAGF
ncbi:MAG: hypothetical protein B6245_04290 [Desulfobacteraceae bacterium 4572_88]|nr:MAG: hypothetical protein B6245_04290 [Desulfobacteraceae bacterium 4572_88]